MYASLQAKEKTTPIALLICLALSRSIWFTMQQQDRLAYNSLLST